MEGNVAVCKGKCTTPVDIIDVKRKRISKEQKDAVKNKGLLGVLNSKKGKAIINDALGNPRVSEGGETIEVKKTSKEDKKKVENSGLVGILNSAKSKAELDDILKGGIVK